MEPFEPKGDDSGSFMLYEMAQEYMKIAKELELKDKIEQAFKYYKEAANKLLYLIK